jgi:hypothetical protein
VTTPVFIDIIQVVIYFVVPTPFGLLRRTLDRSPLHR